MPFVNACLTRSCSLAVNPSDESQMRAASTCPSRTRSSIERLLSGADITTSAIAVTSPPLTQRDVSALVHAACTDFVTAPGALHRAEAFVFGLGGVAEQVQLVGHAAAFRVVQTLQSGGRPAPRRSRP